MNKALSDKQLINQYLAESREWDADISMQIKRSEKRAWRCCILLTLIAVLQGVGLLCLLPLKTIEPFVIRVDNNTGLVDVVSTLASQGQVKVKAQEALDKYWLGQYVQHREAFQWQTRSYDRKLVALLSADNVQQDYGAETDPKSYPQAPLNLYGQSAQVLTHIYAISFISKDKVAGEQQTTALVRYSKQIKRIGEVHPLTHWVATITFVYRNAPMSLENRRLNPLGFQVVSYRNDQATGGD
ncbi:virB8 family protein [Parashewanella hymeniacidonis]|uniref:virB8 family protein n=1 Tax=Parashewanella hymeniacidonis TaxID=2807618 RepID=UPI001EF6552C|nr:VirB8/TrbF family protein [Parashewanella hymeniacidonis]